MCLVVHSDWRTNWQVLLFFLCLLIYICSFDRSFVFHNFFLILSLILCCVFAYLTWSEENFLMSISATLIISFTDYKNLALVYYCFKYRPGSRAQCQKNGMQIEIISKDLNPNKKEINGYIKRSGKRLCAPGKTLKATHPGMINVPIIAFHI